jgi:formate-dependent nitrite reductase cytochrome c552 subunit
MTKKLEEVFGFPPIEEATTLDDTLPEVSEEIQEQLNIANATIDMANRVDIALPTVTDMASAERELDKLANTAQEQSERLMDLGFNVDDRNAGKIFEVAAQLLKTAVDAKTAKIDKKLKMVELQLRKARMDRDEKNSDSGNVLDATEGGITGNRNDIVQAILKSVGHNK